MAPTPAIDFHFNVEHRIGYACRVVRKALAAQRSVMVHCPEAARLAQMDLALWTFSALDFLPHVTLPSPHAELTPVWLDSTTPPRGQRDVLLLLGDTVPEGFADWFPGFGRVIDVVSADPGERQAARQRFAHYREAGWAPGHHDAQAA
jgi:DNA polymerase-3 subunit chi